ncbi:uncharacterized protein PAC_13453 [Phialocephala subalpina]|uniref:Uncharacterized protein n=1 Tax=Phialocephala subalpina TaxID=576137 RepID=A0A1L7XF10_9HELO|nr:uncharacterized protein PAC_13453 [Phialocephala subalpina]
MLAATRWYDFGVDFTYTDAIDYNDPMQACIQNIENPSMQRNFEETAIKQVQNGPENPQFRKILLAAATKKAKKKNGSKMSVGFRYAVLALAVSVGATVYFS